MTAATSVGGDGNSDSTGPQEQMPSSAVAS